MKIFEANETPPVRKAGGYKHFILRQLRGRYGAAAALINWSAKGEPVKAFVSRGWWAATCPNCELPLPADVNETFWCPRCQNVMNGGYARPVEFPNSKAAIEAALEKRINPKKQNWKVGEAVENLLAENAAHPLEVLE